MVARAGVQPATFALGVRCSMQLSYRANRGSVPCGGVQALPQPREITRGFRHSSSVAKATQLAPVWVLTR